MYSSRNKYEFIFVEKRKFLNAVLKIVIMAHNELNRYGLNFIQYSIKKD